MKVACFCGTVYTFQYDSTCPNCGEKAFSVPKPTEKVSEFADRMSAFVRMSREIQNLPEVKR